jgi:mRNA interferase MazF
MASRFMIKGKIVLVPFPFDDMTATKLQPALCLTDSIGPHRHLVVAFISSQMPSDPSVTDVTLDPRLKDFQATGLRVASVLRLHRLVTLTTALFRRDLGALPKTLQDEVDRKLALLFRLKIP